MEEFNIENSRWTPIERVADKKGQQRWLMKCVCGTQREVYWKNYLRGRSRSCGCYRREISKGLRINSRTLPSGEAARNDLLLQYRRGSVKRGLSFELTKEQFTELTSSRCHFCNRPPHRFHHPVTKGINGGYHYNGIDRRDNSLGYTKENCLTACTECNRAKNIMSYNEFIEYLNALVAYRNTL